MALVSLAAWPVPTTLPAPMQAEEIAIVGASVVDPRGEGEVSTNRTVLIVRGRILHVGPSGGLAFSPEARIIDGRGMYIIPGLWDAHAHTLRLSPQLHLPLFIAQGVTSIRDMGDSCSWSETTTCRPDRLVWLSQLRLGEIVGPRIVQTASFHLEKMPENRAALATLVAGLKDRGDSVVKVQLDDVSAAGDLAAVVAEAERQGMRVAGHVPFATDFKALPVPMSSVDHDTSLLPQCSDAGATFDGSSHSKPALLKGFSTARCTALLRAMAADGTAYVPTHIASSGQDLAFATGEPLLDAVLRDRYVAAPQRWLWGLLRAAGRTEEMEQRTLQDVHRAALALTRSAHAAGVPVLAGTDALDADVLHGFALHRELRMLVEAGLTPAQALAAATIVPATWSGQADRLGTVEAGKQADLVLLSANPLQDIGNTARIEWVIADGRVYGPQERAAALAYVQTQAGRWSVVARYLRGLWYEG